MNRISARNHDRIQAMAFCFQNYLEAKKKLLRMAEIGDDRLMKGKKPCSEKKDIIRKKVERRIHDHFNTFGEKERIPNSEFETLVSSVVVSEKDQEAA